MCGMLFIPDCFWFCVYYCVDLPCQHAIESTHSTGFCTSGYLGIWTPTRAKIRNSPASFFAFLFLCSVWWPGQWCTVTDNSCQQPLSWHPPWPQSMTASLSPLDWYHQSNGPLTSKRLIRYSDDNQNRHKLIFHLVILHILKTTF